MKQAKPRTVAFECSPYEAYLLRRYAESLTVKEVDLEEHICKATLQMIRDERLQQINQDSRLQQLQLLGLERQQQQQGLFQSSVFGLPLGRLF